MTEPNAGTLSSDVPPQTPEDAPESTPATAESLNGEDVDAPEAGTKRPSPAGDDKLPADMTQEERGVAAKKAIRDVESYYGVKVVGQVDFRNIKPIGQAEGAIIPATWDIGVTP